MSTFATPALDDPAIAAPARPARVVTGASLLGAAAVTTLIGSQLVTVTAAFVYSLVLLLHISTTVATGLGTVFGALALWGTVVVAKLAFEAETDPVNN